MWSAHDWVVVRLRSLPFRRFGGVAHLSFAVVRLSGSGNFTCKKGIQIQTFWIVVAEVAHYLPRCFVWANANTFKTPRKGLQSCEMLENDFLGRQERANFHRLFSFGCLLVSSRGYYTGCPIK